MSTAFQDRRGVGCGEGANFFPPCEIRFGRDLGCCGVRLRNPGFRHADQLRYGGRNGGRIGVGEGG